MNKVRCAIYTRKSSDEGLDQAFNSLDAQREACEAYIRSQKHEGWTILPTLYDDGGASGGNLERTALQQLLAEVDAGRVDMIVVYKIDRLTRSLSDFARLVDRLDAAGASFVSVTQQFNTSTSMGRLTLNVLLSFAQFEREVTAERIRDKIAASKKKGMWMGGLVPLGYDKGESGLVINPQEAETVQSLFQAYLDLDNVRKVKEHADAHKHRTKTRTTKSGRVIEAKPFSRGRLYHLLSNPIYVGRIRHKNALYDGKHEAIIPTDMWDQVQARLKANSANRTHRTNASHRSMLCRKLFDEDGAPLTPSHACKGGRRYRYYVSRSGIRLPAKELEQTVLSALESDRALQLAYQQTSIPRPSGTAWHLHIERIDLTEERLEVSVKIPGSHARHQVTATYTLRRRGVEQRILLEDSLVSRPDLVLIRRTLKAAEWIDSLKQGLTISDIAARENVTPEYITHNIGLGHLSPKIMTALATGMQRPDVSAYQFSKVQIPVAWRDQDRLFFH